MPASSSPSAKKQKLFLPSNADVEPQLYCKRLSENAQLPTRGSPDAAGYDLYRLACAEYVFHDMRFSLNFCFKEVF